MELIVLAGCDTGNLNDDYGNLVDMALSSGARIAIGWKEDVYAGYTATYLERFTFSLSGQSVREALTEADGWVDRTIDEQKCLLNRYVGSSPLNSVNLA